MNNSNTLETLGVLHKALIINKDINLDRVIDSTMIFSSGLTDPDPFTIEQQNEFIITNVISKELK